MKVYRFHAYRFGRSCLRISAVNAFWFLLFGCLSPGILPVALSAQASTKSNSSVPRATPTPEQIKEIETLLDQAEKQSEIAMYNEAYDLASNGLVKAESAGYIKGIALSHNIIGTIYYRQRILPKAKESLNTSLLISEENNLQPVIASNKMYLGALNSVEGKADEGMRLVNEALDMFNGLGDIKGQGIAHLHLGGIHRSQGRLDQALEHYNTAYKLSEQISYTWGMASSLGGIGTIYATRGQHDEARKYFTDGLNLWQKMGNKSGIADTYHHIGTVHFLKANYTDALSHYLNSLKLRQELDDSIKIAESYHDIGHIYFKQNQYEEALINYEKALKIFKEAGIKQRIGIAHNSLGNTYSELGEMPKALENYEASIAMQEAIGDKPGLVYSLNNIGNLYIAQGDYTSAKKHLMAAMQLGTELEDLENLAFSYQHLGALALHTGQLVMAKENVEKSISISKQTGNKNTAMYAYNLLARIDSTMGNYQQALVDYKLYKIYSDSLTTEEKEGIIADLKISYETERKDLEIQRLENERELQQSKLNKQTMLKNYFIGGLILFALLSFFAYNYFVTRQKLKLQTLRNKIASDLHDDVGSTLSSIAIFSEIAQEQSKDVMPLLQTIGESSRKMLEAMTDIVWTINPENDQFENIILRMRSYAYELLGAKDIGFDFTADEDLTNIKLPMNVRKNLFLIFKEATNNIIKYSGADKALFSLKSDRKSLSMMIRDNGIGFDLNKPTDGNGLKNMQRRAKEVGGKLLIESLPGHGTTIELNIAV